MNTVKQSQLQDCSEYRILANKCYYMTEDEFIDLLLKKHDEKIQYAEFLENKGSILAESYRKKQSVFRMKDTGPSQF